MDVLKKLKSATLVEALIATVLIVVIFIVSSLVINNLLLNGFNNNTTEVQNRLYQLEYELQNKKIQLPYKESFNDWDVAINKVTATTSDKNSIELKAQKNQSTKKIISKRIDE